jgi:hypothetical protein
VLHFASELRYVGAQRRLDLQGGVASRLHRPVNEAVTIIIIKDDEGHAPLIEKNDRAAGINLAYPVDSHTH